MSDNGKVASLEAFAQDVQAARGGVWFDYLGNIKLKVRRITYPPYQAALTKLIVSARGRRHNLGETGDIPTEEIRQPIADHLLADWNMTTPDGERIPYSPEKAMGYFMDERFEGFSDDVVALAKQADAYRATALEDAAGN